MYIDPKYAVTDHDRILEAMAARPFATVLPTTPPLHVAHVPFVIDTEVGRHGGLTGHVPRVDPLADALRTIPTLLVIFFGPAAYVSPSMYADAGLPTYNYVAIHARGTPQVMDNAGEVRRHLDMLTASHERARKSAWRPDRDAAATIDALIPDIQVFTMEIEHVEAKFKLSQNRSTRDRPSVIDGLRAAAAQDDHMIAGLMADLYDEHGSFIEHP